MTVPGGTAAGSAGGASRPGCTSTFQPCSAEAGRLARVRRETAAIEASASPRKPSEVTRSRSASEAILLVAWRVRASGSCSRAMPRPLSMICRRRRPPSSMRISIWVAPASRAFSSSSLMAEAGRSITSPAAIWLIRMSGSTAMGRDAAVSVAAGRENWLAESVMANRWGRRVGRWASIIGSAFARRRHTAIAAAGNPLG